MTRRRLVSASAPPCASSGVPLANVPYNTKPVVRSGIGRGEQQAHRAALADTEQGRSFRSHRVQDRMHIFHALLKWRNANHRVRQARAPLVVENQPAHRRKTPHERGAERISPAKIEMRHESGHHQDVDGTITNDLVRNVHVSIAGIARSGRHGRPCSHEMQKKRQKKKKKKTSPPPFQTKKKHPPRPCPGRGGGGGGVSGGAFKKSRPAAPPLFWGGFFSPKKIFRAPPPFSVADPPNPPPPPEKPPRPKPGGGWWG